MDSGPSQTVDYKQLWNNYYGWRSDISNQGARDLSLTRAKMASQGGRRGQTGYDTVVQGVEDRIAEEIKEIETGYSANTLRTLVENNYLWEKQQKPLWGERYSHKQLAQMSDEELEATLTDPESLREFRETEHWMKTGEYTSGFDSDNTTYANRLTYDQLRESNKDTYTKLSNALGRDPEEWEFKAAVALGLPEQKESRYEKEKAATERVKQNAIGGGTEVSPGLDTVQTESASPWT